MYSLDRLHARRSRRAYRHVRSIVSGRHQGEAHCPRRRQFQVRLRSTGGSSLPGAARIAIARTAWWRWTRRNGVSPPSPEWWA